MVEYSDIDGIVEGKAGVESRNVRGEGRSHSAVERRGSTQKYKEKWGEERMREEAK